MKCSVISVKCHNKICRNVLDVILDIEEFDDLEQRNKTSTETGGEIPETMVSLPGLSSIKRKHL